MCSGVWRFVRQSASAPPSARGSLPTSRVPSGRGRMMCAWPTASSTSSSRSIPKPASASRGGGGVGHGALGLDDPVPAIAPDRPARGRDRLAGAHPQVERPDQVLRVDLRLRGAAHRPGDRRQPAFAVHEHRHQRVERPLPRRDLVRVIGLQRETAAAVVGDDPGLRFQDRGAEAVPQALDQRDRPAFGVGGHHGDRVARAVAMAGHRGRRDRVADAVRQARRGVRRRAAWTGARASRRGRPDDGPGRGSRPRRRERACRRPDRADPGRSPIARRARASPATRSPGCSAGRRERRGPGTARSAAERRPLDARPGRRP